MDASSVINELALSVIAGCFLLNFWLLLFVYNRSVVNENRLDVQDRITSAIADEEFDSGAVAKGDQPMPSTKRIRRLLAKEV